MKRLSIILSLISCIATAETLNNDATAVGSEEGHPKIISVKSTNSLPLPKKSKESKKTHKHKHAPKHHKSGKNQHSNSRRTHTPR